MTVFDWPFLISVSAIGSALAYLVARLTEQPRPTRSDSEQQ